MHPDEEALLQTVFDRPDDDAPRLVYADWLEETGEPANVARAEFIRVQVELEAPGTDPARAEELHDREEELLARFQPVWDRPFATNWLFWEYRRGFVDRFHHRGLFRAPAPDGSYSSYLRFFADGTVMTLWTPNDPREAALRIRRSALSLARGEYALQLFPRDRGIRFSARDSRGAVDYTGSFDGRGLLLDTHSRINGHRGRERYHWVDVPVPDERAGEH